MTSRTVTLQLWTSGQKNGSDLGTEMAEVAGPDVAGDTNYQSHMSADEMRQDYSSLTIQTNPEDAEKAIQTPSTAQIQSTTSIARIAPRCVGIFSRKFSNSMARASNRRHCGLIFSRNGPSRPLLSRPAVSRPPCGRSRVPTLGNPDIQWILSTSYGRFCIRLCYDEWTVGKS